MSIAPIPTLLLAAGASSRMGGSDKLLRKIRGHPLLTRISARACATGPVYVTLPGDEHPRCTALPKAAHIVPVRGQMADSIKAGISALPADTAGVIILPADMPDITAQDIAIFRETARALDPQILRATNPTGVPGHPVYFSHRLFSEFAKLTGDAGAAPICRKYAAETTFVPLPDQRALLDLDTPEDWENFEKF